jgi:signal peptidase II
MISGYLTKQFYINLLIIITIFIIDRVSKAYVIYLDKFNQGYELFTSKFLNIFLIWNKGIAFGFFSFDQGYLYKLITLIITIVVCIIFIMMMRNNGFKKYSLLLILGGSLGNLYDRILYAGVPDFIDFHIGELHWFIFNIADIFITLGVIFMILLEFFDNKKKTYE